MADCFVACEKREHEQASLGCLILATNDLDQDGLNASEVLSTYNHNKMLKAVSDSLKALTFCSRHFILRNQSALKLC